MRSPWANPTDRLPKSESEPAPAACLAVYGFGGLECDREAGHPGPHRNRDLGVWFNGAGERVDGGSAEDYA